MLVAAQVTTSCLGVACLPVAALVPAALVPAALIAQQIAADSASPSMSCWSAACLHLWRRPEVLGRINSTWLDAGDRPGRFWRGGGLVAEGTGSRRRTMGSRSPATPVVLVVVAGSRSSDRSGQPFESNPVPHQVVWAVWLPVRRAISDRSIITTGIDSSRAARILA